MVFNLFKPKEIKTKETDKYIEFSYWSGEGSSTRMTFYSSGYCEYYNKRSTGSGGPKEPIDKKFFLDEIETKKIFDNVQEILKNNESKIKSLVTQKESLKMYNLADLDGLDLTARKEYVEKLEKHLLEVSCIYGFGRELGEYFTCVGFDFGSPYIKRCPITREAAAPAEEAIKNALAPLYKKIDSLKN